MSEASAGVDRASTRGGASASMHAIGFRGYGGVAELGLVELARPEPGYRQVRIRTLVTPVNPADVHFRAGGVAKLVGDAERPFVPGLELGGIVDAVGAGTHFQVGDEVVAVTTFIPTGRGAQAQFVVVDAEDVAKAIVGVPLAQLATLPMNGLTALACADRVTASLDPATLRVAVIGAAGVVGRLVVQLLAERGCEVTGVGRAADGPELLRLGAARVIERDEAVASVLRAVPGGVDAVGDCAVIGAAAFPMLRAGGRLVLLRPLGPDEYPVAASLGIEASLVSVREYQGNGQRLQQLVNLAGRGDLTLSQVRVRPLADFAEAHSAASRGSARTRQVIAWP
jgi:NADPH:quinone reductase